ncbi:MAG: hypothetical protein ACI808_000322, partial [Paraglaciecola sp.]
VLSCGWIIAKFIAYYLGHYISVDSDNGHSYW